jgi:hypothetical protein
MAGEGARHPIGGPTARGGADPPELHTLTATGRMVDRLADQARDYLRARTIAALAAGALLGLTTSRLGDGNERLREQAWAWLVELDALDRDARDREGNGGD